MKVVTMIIDDYLNWQGFELDQIETKSQKKEFSRKLHRSHGLRVEVNENEDFFWAVFPQT